MKSTMGSQSGWEKKRGRGEFIIDGKGIKLLAFIVCCICRIKQAGSSFKPSLRDCGCS